MLFEIIYLFYIFVKNYLEYILTTLRNESNVTFLFRNLLSLKNHKYKFLKDIYIILK